MRRIHGESGNQYTGSPRSAEYGAWSQMKRRCYNRNTPQWKDWGGRGITVCQRWLDSYADFVADVGRRPSARHSLDRWPNPNGNYEPGNVRWATQIQQVRNMPQHNRIVTANGLSLCTTEWQERTGIHRRTITTRLANGWKPEQAVTVPPRVHCSLLTFNGKTQSHSAWARELGVSPSTILGRIKSGRPLDEVLLRSKYPGTRSGQRPAVLCDLSPAEITLRSYKSQWAKHNRAKKVRTA